MASSLITSRPFHFIGLCPTRFRGGFESVT
jgi:hypothetical protein